MEIGRLLLPRPTVRNRVRCRLVAEEDVARGVEGPPAIGYRWGDSQPFHTGTRDSGISSVSSMALNRNSSPDDGRGDVNPMCCHY